LRREEEQQQPVRTAYGFGCEVYRVARGGTVGSTRVQLHRSGSFRERSTFREYPRGYYPVDLPGIVVQERGRGVCANDHQPLVKEHGRHVCYSPTTIEGVVVPTPQPGEHVLIVTFWLWKFQVLRAAIGSSSSSEGNPLPHVIVCHPLRPYWTRVRGGSDCSQSVTSRTLPES
jgi:hypothetical protein